MNTIVCKLTQNDNFEIEEPNLVVNLYNKDEYHTTFFKYYRLLTKLPNPFPNNALDLFYISLIVFYADRRIRRSDTDDAWTRQFKVYMPVLELDKWIENKKLLTRTVSYLSGDKWEFHFRKRSFNDQEKRFNEGISKSKKSYTPSSFCMLSGGLDSFIGAIDLLQSNKDISFVSHYGGGKGVKQYQDLVKELLINQYDLSPNQFFSFHAAPIGGLEDSTRTRSLMFFAHAIILASSMNRGINIFIPENGLISLNIPFTNSRLGSSSTRTTHPYYLGLLQELISNLGLSITLINPYQFQTKGQMIQNCKNQDFLKDNISNTMSCSHPDQGRYSGESTPMHCGTCVPCIIRRASIEKALGIDSFDYRDKNFTTKKSKTELNSYKIGILEYINAESNLSFRIQGSGPLLNNLSSYEDLYKAGMEELKALLDQYN
jgi:hypothetical protein